LWFTDTCCQLSFKQETADSGAVQGFHTLAVLVRAELRTWNSPGGVSQLCGLLAEYSSGHEIHIKAHDASPLQFTATKI